MCTDCQSFDLGKIFVTKNICRLLMRDTVTYALHCHVRFASHANRPGTAAGNVATPRLVRTTHLCCDDRSDRHVAFDILTLQISDCVRTVVHLSDHGDDYGSVSVVHARPEPNPEEGWILTP